MERWKYVVHSIQFNIGIKSSREWRDSFLINKLAPQEKNWEKKENKQKENAVSHITI